MGTIFNSPTELDKTYNIKYIINPVFVYYQTQTLQNSDQTLFSLINQISFLLFESNLKENKMFFHFFIKQDNINFNNSHNCFCNNFDNEKQLINATNEFLYEIYGDHNTSTGHPYFHRTLIGWKLTSFFWPTFINKLLKYGGTIFKSMVISDNKWLNSPYIFDLNWIYTQGPVKEIDIDLLDALEYWLSQPINDGNNDIIQSTNNVLLKMSEVLHRYSKLFE